MANRYTPILFVYAMCLGTSEAASVPSAYERAANKYSIPTVLLYSMALNESRKKHTGILRPWPWTANFQSKSYYFDSREELFEFASSLLSMGYKSIDLGPMQVNWKWNGHLFTNLWEATDPYINIDTGASILSSHYFRLGSFEKAVGAYHSPSNTNNNADKYRESVRTILGDFLEGRI